MSLGGIKNWVKGTKHTAFLLHKWELLPGWDSGRSTRHPVTRQLGCSGGATCVLRLEWGAHSQSNLDQCCLIETSGEHIYAI